MARFAMVERILRLRKNTQNITNSSDQLENKSRSHVFWRSYSARPLEFCHELDAADFKGSSNHSLNAML
jgi:hypothetical protein